MFSAAVILNFLMPLVNIKCHVKQSESCNHIRLQDFFWQRSVIYSFGVPEFAFCDLCRFAVTAGFPSFFGFYFYSFCSFSLLFDEFLEHFLNTDGIGTWYIWRISIRRMNMQRLGQELLTTVLPYILAILQIPKRLGFHIYFPQSSCEYLFDRTYNHPPATYSKRVAHLGVCLLLNPFSLR